MFVLRPVRMEDAEDLFDWKNDKCTRAHALVTEEKIKWEDHLKWLACRIEKPGFYLITDEGMKCGWIRFDITHEIEVAIVINPILRGRGIACEVVGIASSMMQSLHNKPLWAKIVDGNEASLIVFSRAGFQVTGHGVHNGKGYSILKKGC